jgi:hypothetical protein
MSMVDAVPENRIPSVEQSDKSTQYTNDTVLLEPFTSSPKSPVEPDLTFAKLVPINPLAKAAFLEVARFLEEDTSGLTHLKQFVHVRTSKSLTCVSDEEGNDEQQDDSPGYYRLSLGILPQAWNLGWVLGRGIPHLPNRAVDILLTLDGHVQGVRGRHARLRPNLDSGALMLIADKGKTVYLNGQPIRGDAYMIHRMISALNFGDLAYSLQFTKLNDDIFKDKLETLKRTLGGYKTPMYSSLQVTPSNRHFELQGFEIQVPIGSGTYGVVFPCRQLSNGNAYAAKCVRRNPRSMKDVKKEIDIYKRIGQHVSHHPLVEYRILT